MFLLACMFDMNKGRCLQQQQVSSGSGVLLTDVHRDTRSGTHY